MFHLPFYLLSLSTPYFILVIFLFYLIQQGFVQFLLFFKNIPTFGCWRNDQKVKNSCWSFRGPVFCSQHPSQEAQWFVHVMINNDYILRPLWEDNIAFPLQKFTIRKKHLMSNHYKDSQCRMWSQLNYFGHLTLETPSITSVYSANRDHLRNHLKTK